MFDFLRRWLPSSPHVHLRQRGPEAFSELVALFDRFLDGPMAYPLEWDDFISWKNQNPNIEAIRERLGQSEAMLFSRDPAQKARYGAAVIEERNKAAALCGLAARDQDTHS
jgi:hypothetical protein